MIDIAEQDALIAYLAERGVFADARAARIRYFSGGVSGTVALAADAGRGRSSSSRPWPN
jgi:hypothetical protein